MEQSKHRRREPLRAEPAAAKRAKAAREPTVIDLRFGQPGQCPSCLGPAELIHIDISRRVSRHGCGSCEREWWVSEAEPGVVAKAP